jgi:hypothetical protein
MPSAGNISELVFFGLIAAGITAMIMIGFRLSPAGRRKDEEEENWDPDNLGPLPVRQRYVDPVSNKAVIISLAIFFVFVTIAFIYYFATKGGFTPGN